MNPFVVAFVALAVSTTGALAVSTSGALAQVAPAAIEDRPLITEADSLEQFQWVARPVVVFADSPNDPRFIKQIELLNARKQELFDRDVVVIADTDPSARSPVRLQLRPRGFMLVLMAKDGTVVLRKPTPWDVRELTRQIDKLPLRKQEIRDELSLKSGG